MDLLSPLLLVRLQTLNPVLLRFPLAPGPLNPLLLIPLRFLNPALLRSPLAPQRPSQTSPRTRDMPGRSLRDTSILQLSRSNPETRRQRRLQASTSRPMAPRSYLMRQSFCRPIMILIPLRKTRSLAMLRFRRLSSLRRIWHRSGRL
jgi:hypothetical protein